MITDDGPNIWNRNFASPAVLNGQTYLNGALVDGRATPRPKQMAVLSLVTTGPVNAGNFGHDRDDNTRWFGDLAELIVYDAPLSDADRKAVETYLARKYDIPAGTAATPTFSPAGGTFTPPLAVTLSGSVADAIRYTLDGSEPTATSALYDGPITLDRSTIVKARAFGRALAPSATATATFIDSTAAPETTMTGRLVDRDGNPLAGATVTCGTLAATTDGDGRFALAHVSTAITVACSLSATLADGTLVTDVSARVTALPGASTDLGSMALTKPTYVGYNPADNATLDVVGWTNGTAYRLTALDDGRLVASGTIDRYQAVSLSLSQVRHFELVTTAPVQAGFGFDCCGVGGSFFYPATDGRKLIGRDFVIRIPVLSGNNDFVVFAHQAATVTITNAATGALAFNQALSAGQVYATTGSPLAAGVVYLVHATGDVSLTSNAANGFTAVPARTGADVGTEFSFGIRPYSTGAFAVFGYDDASVTVTNAQTGAVVFTGTVGAGQVTYQNGLGDAKYRLTSTGRVGVFAGSTEGGNALRDLGDDVTFTIGDHGREFVVHSLSQGAFVFALEHDTHVTINGTGYVLEAGQFGDLPSDVLWRITSDKPVVVEAIGGNGLNDWYAALRLVER